MTQTSTIDPTKVAAFLLQLVAKAQVSADDDTLAAVQTARAFLRNIAAGDVIVTNKPAPPTGPQIDPQTGFKDTV